MLGTNPMNEDDLKTQVALLVSKFNDLATDVRRLTDDHEPRMRTIEKDIIQIKERQTIWAMIQTALTIIAGVLVYLAK